ncbi:MAG: ATP-binding protein [Planctomycetota bacterium]
MCLPLLGEMLETFPVIAVVGARQVGKTTLVQLPEIGSDRLYHTLDDVTTAGMARRDPVALARSGPRITIDEVQLAPGLLRVIKREVDRDRTSGRFLLTGSSDLDFSAELGHVLAGRVGVLRVRPLAWREQARTSGVPKLVDWIGETKPERVWKDLSGTEFPPFDPGLLLTGGYPPAVTARSPRRRELWFQSFRTSYLERDLRRLSEVGDLSDFGRLLDLCATRTSQVLNQAALARDLGIPAMTVSRYLSLLEASFQIERMKPYFTNIGKRLVKSPKLYWTDTGVASFFLGLRSWQEAIDANYAGPLLETFAMMEVESLLSVFAPSAKLHYLRTHGGMEIDGVIASGRSLLPFEIKASATVRVEDARHLRAFIDMGKGARFGFVLYAGEECRMLAPDVFAVPLSILLA